jgi:uncharacterized membrane protein
MGKKTNKFIIKNEKDSESNNPDNSTLQWKFVLWKGIEMVLQALVIGLAVGIATILQEPIVELVNSWDFITNETVSKIWTAIIFFLVSLLILIISIFVGKQKNKVESELKNA